MLRFVVIGALLVVNTQCACGEGQVPDWFRFDAARPYAIFEAWQELSTRRAVVCVGENWTVLGGRLLNKQGQPVPNTPIRMHLVPRKAWYADLQTDDSGYFLIYSPYSLELGADEESIRWGLNSRFIVATPGYPTSQAGQAFAHKRKAVRVCEFKMLMKEDDRAFYIVTCDDETEFDAEEFKTFQREYLKQKYEPRAAWRDRPSDPEGKPAGIVKVYDIRVVDEKQQGVPDVLVKYQLSGLNPGFQIRRTDEEGRCKLEEWERSHGDRIYRILTIDAPGFGVGPVPFAPIAGEENRIRLARPAVVAGKVVDDLGNPLACQLSVQYKRLAYLAFETDFHSQADGTFRFERVMPNEEFMVVARGSYSPVWRWSGVRSDWLSLGPGVTSEEVPLRMQLAGSLRGIVVSEDGTLVPVHPALDYGPRENRPGNELWHYVGTNNGPWGPKDGRFGFYGLDDRPFHLRVSGWEVDPSGPIQVEPGEMRFIRVTLKKKKDQ